MALQALCTNCKSSFTLPDEVTGKKVRCKNCQIIFVAQAAPTHQIDELEVADAVEEVVAVEAVEEVEVVEEVDAVEEVEAVEVVPRRKARPMVDEVEEVVELDEPVRPKAKTAVLKGAPAAAPRRNGVADRMSPAAPVAARGERAAPRSFEPADAPKGSNVPLILGTLLAGLVILVGGGIGLAFILKGGAADTTPVAVAPPPAPPPYVAPPPPPPVVIGVLPAPQTPPPGGNTGGPADPVTSDPKTGKMTPEAKEAVKRATVFIMVTMADGSKASGTGFFGCAESPNLILTNAHVVGMLSPDSLRPQKVEITINSGQPDEDEGQAQILGVDRSSDLAVLEMLPATKKSKPLPKPILVRTAEKLTELDDLVVFGFPLGTALGKEITIRPTTVSSLRKIAGTNLIEKIQVNGGMDPGNSGGPVVDIAGHVVGVAVSGIQGRQINFAIPGERVHTILNGRISEFGTGQPFITSDKRIGVPITVVLLDPRNLIKDVALEVWTGDPGPGRGPTKTAPEPVAGDSARQRFPLTVNGRERKGEMLLAPLPDGKVYWTQPVFTNGAGQTMWVSAMPYKIGSQPVERLPADLVFAPPPGVHRDLTVTTNSTFKIGDDEDSVVGKSVIKVVFDAKVEAANQQGTAVSLRYLGVDKTNFEKVGNKGTPEDFKPFPSEMLKAAKPHLGRVALVQAYDNAGNLKGTTADAAALRALGPQAAKLVTDWNQPVAEALNGCAVPLPNKKGVAPNESWKATRNFPIETPSRQMMATYNLTYTYVGQRQRDGRTEAYISIAGELDAIDGKNVKVGASLTGTALVDLATGEVIQVKTDNAMDQQMTFRSPDGPVTMTARIHTNTNAMYSKPKQ